MKVKGKVVPALPLHVITVGMTNYGAGTCTTETLELCCPDGPTLHDSFKRHRKLNNFLPNPVFFACSKYSIVCKMAVTSMTASVDLCCECSSRRKRCGW